MAPLFLSVIKKENGESGQQLHREGPGRLRGPWHPAGRGHSHTSSRGEAASWSTERAAVPVTPGRPEVAVSPRGVPK